MRETCHRCHAELPLVTGDDEERTLYCPRCGAPQLHFPDHMRPQPDPALATTGALPPPRPGAAAGFAGSANAAGSTGHIDWRACLPAAALVAGPGALLMLAGLYVPLFSFAARLWTLAASILALQLYLRRSRSSTMDARVGMRIGLTTGMMLVVAMAVVLAFAGLVARFGTHTMAGFDADWQRTFAEGQVLASRMVPAPPDASAETLSQMKATQQQFNDFLMSPEGRAGAALVDLGLLAALLVALCAGIGAVAGVMRTSPSARPGWRRGN